MNFGIAYLLTGKVASGKTTFARKKEAQENAVFLSIDELQLSMFGQTPTREQLDSTYEGARAYQFKQALKFLQKGIDVYFDWGLWSKAQRALYKNQLEKLG
ncbi:MAG: putative kinase, partial [Reinekea sp.]